MTREGWGRDFWYKSKTGNEPLLRDHRGVKEYRVKEINQVLGKVRFGNKCEELIGDAVLTA